MASAWNLPWLLAGEFNDILYAQEKYLGRSKEQWDDKDS